MKASLVFFPNQKKKSSKNGRIPLYTRVCYNGRKCERRLAVDICETDLLKWDMFTMRFAERSSPYNHVLNMIDQRFVEFVSLNALQLNNYTAESILNHVTNSEKPKQLLVCDYIDNYYKNVIQTNTQLSKGTVKNYKKAINHMKAFLAFRKTPDLPVNGLSNPLALEFKDYLLGSFENKKTKGMTEPSAAANVKKFRTIFDRAILEGHIEKNPFKILKLKHRSPRRGRLTIGEVSAIKNLDLSLFPAQAVYRDIFMFSIYTGFAYQDSISLTHANIRTDKDGEIKISTDRLKTSVLAEMFLVKEAIEIIRRYEIDTEKRVLNSLLPYRSNKEVNLQLKFLGNLANIPLKLTTHIARHTYRQLLAEAGIEDAGIIKRMMGQTRSNDIDDVYYLVTDSRLLEAKKKYQNYLNANLY